MRSSHLGALLTLAIAVAGTGCLRGNQSDACEILADCMCGALVGAERFECLQGDNRLDLPIGVRGYDAGESGFARMTEDQCLVILHQEGGECPHGDLTVGPRDPDPTRRCVHDNDCESVRCDCGGSAMVSAELRMCIDGLCVDGVAECGRRCLDARIVRGDPCEMLRSCRCAPLLDAPEVDVDANGEPDLAECLGRLNEPNPALCLEAANRAQPDADGEVLPRAACPDALTFIRDPATVAE